MDKHDTGRRSHYLTVQFSIYDAPAVDELVVALGAATRGRPHHRIGDRYSDLKLWGVTQKTQQVLRISRGIIVDTRYELHKVQLMFSSKLKISNTKPTAIEK